MTQALSFDQIRAYALGAGFQGQAADIAAAVALAESGGNPAAVGDQTAPSGPSFGLWQINSVHAGAEKALDPAIGAGMAYQISSGGTDWRPWTTYRTGAYLRYMPAAPAAAVVQAPVPPPAPVAASTIASPVSAGVKTALSAGHVLIAGGGIVGMLTTVIEWIGHMDPALALNGDVAAAIAGLTVATAGYWHLSAGTRG